MEKSPPHVDCRDSQQRPFKNVSPTEVISVFAPHEFNPKAGATAHESHKES